MSAAPAIPREAERLHALGQYDILDTPAEQAYDDFTRLAAAVCGTPIALISLIDEQRQWFKSRLGLDVAETPRDLAFCAHAIGGPGLLIVPDATLDERFEDNPLVTGDPNIRFYAGAPLTTGDGLGLGTLCVIDRVPRDLSPSQLSALAALSRQVMAQLDLRKALADLRAAEEAKKQFVAHVSHELRTPLTSIRGALALVLHGDPGPDDDSRDLLSAAHRSADRLLALVNDLLDLERVGSAHLSISKQSCTLDVVVTRAVDTVRPIAADAGVTVIPVVAPVAIEADPERLAQVVINLLANAVRFSPRGGCVTVTVEDRAETVRVTVDDQGPGVPAAYRAAIFEPFTQVEGSAAHKKGGTGLGLTIAHAIVSGHGGSLHVGDAPGGGARFWFDLPRAASTPS